MTVKDPAKSDEVVFTSAADIATTIAPYMHEFTIPVETVVGGLKKYFTSATRRALKVQVVADPINRL